MQEFILILFSILLMENIFNWLFIQNSLVIEGYQKLAGILVYGFMLYSFGSLKKWERVIVICFSLVMVRLVFESLIKYDSFFRQLTMFTVLAPVMYVLFVKYILRNLQLDLLEFMAKFYLITYIVFMLLFGRGFSFSLDAVDMNDYGPFSGDSRIIHASHIFMMIVPLLWYLNSFLTTHKLKFLWPLLLCIALIVVHQHRSVWSSSLIALSCYLFASVRNRFIKLSGIMSLILGALALIIISYVFISNLFPGFLDFLSDRFSEILDPAKEGSTGNFRIEQREVYLPMAMQRPVFGWTFEGFEMSNPLVDWWPEMTGQHFHEGYVEMIFYLGFVGLFLKYGFIAYLLYRIFSKHLSEQSIILSSFCISALIFSFAYVLPFVFWAMVGMCYYYLEIDYLKQREKYTEEDTAGPVTDYTLVSTR